MRAAGFLAGVWLGIAAAGCGRAVLAQHAASDASLPAPAVAEARKHFTFQGKPIPPFFLADACGGPDAPDLFFADMGGRICAIAVEGLFPRGDGAYVDIKLEDRRSEGGFVWFDFPLFEGHDAGGMGYRFVGTTPSGVTVLEYAAATGGTCTLLGVVFVRFEMETVGVTKGEKRERLIMRLLGEECWGDRVYRDVTLVGNTLRLGPKRTHIPAYRDGMDGARTIDLE